MSKGESNSRLPGYQNRLLVCSTPSPIATSSLSRMSSYAVLSPPKAYDCWREISRAKLRIEIGKEYKFRHDVLVVPSDFPHEVLLGNYLEFFFELYRTANTHTHTTP